jgi:alpha-galactosidase
MDRMARAQAEGKPMNASSPYTSSLRTVARFSSQDFIPDGDLEKPVWKNAKWVKFDHDAFTPVKHFPGAETAVASFWTAGYVYFAFRCKYTTLNIYEGEDPAKERWELWNRDVVEVFANPEPERVNHYYEFEVAPNNQWIDLEIDLDKTPFNDAAWDSGFEHATRLDAPKRLWTCEMRIPLGSLKAERLEPGAQWRVNFYRADGPGNDTQRRFLSWSPIPGAKHSFHAPTRFGVIRFER